MYNLHTSNTNAFRKSGHIGADPDPENIWMSDPVPLLFAYRNFHVCEKEKFWPIPREVSRESVRYIPQIIAKKFPVLRTLPRKNKCLRRTFILRFQISLSEKSWWQFSPFFKFLRNILTNIGENLVWTVETRKWLAHTAVWLRLIYSSKNPGAFLHQKVCGFLHVQLTDFILYWRCNSKVRITINILI
jgi:hypothetical protein